jgi:hypothetical protein
MRNLFFVLVLANLAFLAWQQWFAPEVRVTRLPDTDQPTILLASEVEERVVLAEQPVSDDPALLPELPESDRDAASSENDSAAVEPQTDDESSELEWPPRDALVALNDPSGSLECISIGPFRELSQATAAAAYLRSDGLDPVQRTAEGDIWVGYWVYLEQLPSVEEAEGILDVLRENGISDSYVIPRSDSGTLISLGVFAEIARASNRLGQVNELGYEATISDRTRRGTVYWVDVWLEPDGTLDFEQLQPPGRIVRLEITDCAGA